MALEEGSKVCPGYERACLAIIPDWKPLCYFCEKSRKIVAGIAASQHSFEKIRGILPRVPLCICGGNPLEPEHLLAEEHIRYVEGTNPRYRHAARR